MASFPLHWAELFAMASAAAPAQPKLGVNFVHASAAEVAIPLERGGDTAAALIVQQDLSAFGIAGVVWDCARVFVAFVQQEHPQMLVRQRVVELGAGTGAVGLALALSTAGAVASLLLTDLEAVVPLTAHNVRIAASRHAELRDLAARDALAVQAFCWGDAPTDAMRAVDIVLCSDCLYEPAQYAKLLASLLALTDRGSNAEKAASSPVVLLAYKQRVAARERAFFEAAAEVFDVACVASAAAPGDAIFICRLERSRARTS